MYEYILLYFINFPNQAGMTHINAAVLATKSDILLP